MYAFFYDYFHRTFIVGIYDYCSVIDKFLKTICD